MNGGLEDSFASTFSGDDNVSQSSFRSGDSDHSNMTVADSVKQKTFWHMFVMLTLSMSFCYFIKVVLKSFGSQNFNDDKFLTKVVGISFFCGATARFCWGAL